MDYLLNDSFVNSSEMVDNFLNSTDAPIVLRSSAERQVISGFLFLTSAVGILGNTAVVAAVLAVKTLQTTTNAFVVNLAVADFLTCVDAFLQSVAFLSDELLLPYWLCQVMAFGILICIGCSVNTLVAIALNRLVGITTTAHSGFRKLYTPFKISFMIVLTWGIPIAVATIPLVSDYGELGYNSLHNTCTWRSNRAYQPRYSTLVAFVYFPVQFVMLFVSYLKIYLFVRKTTRSTLRQDRAGDASASNQILQKQLLKRQVAVTKNLFIVVCVFLLCIFPYFALLGLPSALVARILPIASAILMANSCINPIIYGTKHPDFRKAFARVLFCRKKTQSTPQTQSTQETRRSDLPASVSTVKLTSSISNVQLYAENHEVDTCELTRNTDNSEQL
ncbi:octopamine receptor 1-like [Patiria miniata]|uniref:G-protein coupled receptors family 1 profile domain-containing protein n=1 Tax=Patiria miniata TaxID=46514 RepID=A0A913Z1W0_PATMI|nr:octopamine receptor 1-like [Patiria miniata]